MTALLVAADESARRIGDVDAVIASLPVSLAWTPDQADLVAVSGEEGWAERAALAFAAGARGVLVVDPVAASTRTLVALRAAAAERPVVIDRAFAGHPGLAAARSAVAAAELTALLEVRLTIPEPADPAASLLQHLALVRAVGGPIASARMLRSDAHGYWVRGTLADGHPVLVQATVSSVLPAGATVRILDGHDDVTIAIPGGRAARPLRATVTTTAGATTLPTIFETAHRGSWRRLHDAVSASRHVDDLVDLAEDIALIETL